MKVRWTNTVVAFGMALGTGACAVGTDEIDEKEAATSSREIVGGSNTTIAENPWQISLGDSSGFQFCGGTVLSASWILTANHCVTGESPSGLRVNAGFTKQSQRGTGQTRNVSQIVRYPGYSSPENGEDAALLKLSTPLDLSGPNVKAIPYMTPARTAFHFWVICFLGVFWSAAQPTGPAKVVAATRTAAARR